MKEEKGYTVCGAKTRDGTPCQRAPVAGRNRCRLHGGATPKGGKGRVIHGLYKRTLSEDEQLLWNEIQIGNLDEEIRFAKVMLNRAIELNAEIRAAPNDLKNMAGFELSEISKSTNPGSRNGTNVTSKRPDTVALIDRFMGRIANLEKTRAELIAAQGERGEDAMDTARKVQDALKAMIAVETKQRTSSDDEDEPA